MKNIGLFFSSQPTQISSLYWSLVWIKIVQIFSCCNSPSTPSSRPLGCWDDKTKHFNPLTHVSFTSHTMDKSCSSLSPGHFYFSFCYLAPKCTWSTKTPRFPQSFPSLLSSSFFSVILRMLRYLCCIFPLAVWISEIYFLSLLCRHLSNRVQEANMFSCPQFFLTL